MIELEADPAGEQRDDELVEAHALLRGPRDELRVQVGWHSDEELAAGFHGEKIPHTVLTDDTAGGIVSSMLKPEVTTYQLVASNGRPIRKATKVTFPDGRVVRFMERMSKREAIRQAEALS